MPTPAPFPTPALPPPGAENQASETAGLVLSSAFWAFAIVLSIIAVSFFVRERGIKLNLGPLRLWGQWLLNWWRQLMKGTIDQVGFWQEQIRQRLPSRPAPPQIQPWRFIRINGLSPREQLRYFYLSIVRRAADKGIVRPDNRTPAEFAETLKEQFPDADDEIDALTEAFVQARYSHHDIESRDVHPIKKRWKQLRQTIRRRRNIISESEM